MSAPERLAGTLRERILGGEIRPGTPLREQALEAGHGVSRHTVRAALRALAAEGIVTVEPNRGARVTALDIAEMVPLGELRIALEVEAARLALRRHDGVLPDSVHEAAARLRAAERFADITVAHEQLHGAIVAASESWRIVAAHQALSAQLRLFLIQLRRVRDIDGLADEHDALIGAIEDDGPEALRVHITASTEALTTGLKF